MQLDNLAPASLSAHSPNAGSASAEILATPEGFSPDEWTIAKTLIDPVAFAKHWLGLDLWKVQQDIARSVATRKRTRAKACHASGKTAVAAAIAIWWMVRYPQGFVITTAPSWVQVEKHMWGEIHRLLQGSSIKFPEPKKTELYNRSDNYILGMSTNEGVRFQGFHGAHGLIIKDEAPGIRPEIYEAIEGIAAGGDIRELELGNPTQASGPFYEGFGPQREDFGDGLFTISAFDTPNLEGLTLRDLLSMPADHRLIAPWPMLTTRQWVYERFYDWGGAVSRGPNGEIVEIVEPSHPAWASRVLGNFPDQAEDALFSLAWLEAAKKRPAQDSGGKLRAGVDVAGPGEDETTLVIVDDETGSILFTKAWAEKDPRDAVLRELRQYKSRLDIVNVDTVGMGYYFGLHLSDHGYPVKHVNVGLPARNKRRFNLRKDEYYWGLRMRAQDGELSGLVDDVMISQLAAHAYGEDTRGKVRIEGKPDIKSKIRSSPDRAEALMLAFANTRRSRITSGARDDEEAPAVEPKTATGKQLASTNAAVQGYVEAKSRTYATCRECRFFETIPHQDKVGKCTERHQHTSAEAAECDLFSRKREKR